MRELVFLGAFDDFRHRLHHLHGVAPGSRLRREHHRVGAVHDGVRHVAHLGPGRRRIQDHGLHHLRGRDHDAIPGAALVDDGLLQARQLRIPHLNAQVTARHHHYVGGFDDALQVGDRLVTLDLRHDPGFTARFAHELPRQLDIGGIARERHGDVINFLLRAELDVLAVPVGERGCRNSAALAIQALAVGKLAAHSHVGVDFRSTDAIDVEHDLPVVQQEYITGGDVFRQILVGTAYGVDRAPFWVEIHVECEGLPLLQHDLPFAEALDTNLRPTEIEEDADGPVGNPRRLADEPEATPPILDGTVRGVEPNDVDALTHQPDHHVQVIGRRPYGGDNLRPSQHTIFHELR